MSAKCRRLAAGLAVSASLSGVAAAEDNASASVPAASDAAVSVPSLGGSGKVTVPLLGGDRTVPASQRSVAPAYQLSGSGIVSSDDGRAILTSPTKGNPIKSETGVFTYPSASVALGYNDNVVGSARSTVGSAVLVVRPEVVLELERSGDRYTASYSGNYGRYADSGDDDYAHHDFWLAMDKRFTTRARLGAGIGYVSRSDARGSTDRASSAEPDRWHGPIARFIGIYGAEEATGRIEVEGQLSRKRYDNNRAVTRASDLNASTLTGRFFYRVMPKTSMVFEARNTWNDYTLSSSTNDNSYRKLLLGVTWDATAKTTGAIKLGRAFKSYDDSGRDDVSTGTWEASVAWEPLSYSTVSLETAQDVSDSTGVGNYIDNRSWQLRWDHDWSSVLTTSLTATRVISDFSGSDRHDTSTAYGFGVFRELSRNVRAGLTVDVTDRDSSQSEFDFRRNVRMLTLEAVL